MEMLIIHLTTGKAKTIRLTSTLTRLKQFNYSQIGFIAAQVRRNKLTREKLQEKSDSKQQITRRHVYELHLP